VALIYSTVILTAGFVLLFNLILERLLKRARPELCLSLNPNYTYRHEEFIRSDRWVKFWKRILSSKAYCSRIPHLVSLEPGLYTNLRQSEVISKLAKDIPLRLQKFIFISFLIPLLLILSSLRYSLCIFLMFTMDIVLPHMFPRLQSANINYFMIQGVSLRFLKNLCENSHFQKVKQVKFLE
jgi:hypothetical protein